MTVYFFDCFDGHDYHADLFGLDLETDAEAGDQADALVYALMRESLDRGSPETAWVEVRSGAGCAVYSARLRFSRNWAEERCSMSAGSEQQSG